MNRNKLKTYAPQARREFIQAVTDRAAHYGLSAKKIEPMTEQGDVALIGGRPFPKAVGEKRKKLEARIQKLGFGQTMEAMAYTWFNRLVAIRFMELHGYLEHGYRVLSHPDGRSQPEILEHAQHVDLPGLDKQRVVALKLDGTKEEELYRLLLVGQCNALHKALPFLFEAIYDETELLLPDHLLHSDSLIRKLVEEVSEVDWQEVEIIGWLYQFYISEKKDEVIGKVVKSEDIPAATQLFTPNWIVKYLVQNSLGRQWVATYPNSPLKGQMEYYIEPAEQTPEVQAKLAEITPTSLNPEELTLLDPACGSGHILVEAYDLLQRIYQERGYRARDIPRLILERNLFGLEIDDRAAQLAAFALMMKARADDRSIFERGVRLHVLSIQESQGLDAREITEALNQPILKEELPPSGELFEEIADARSPLFSKKSMGVKGAVSQADVAHLISLFEHGKTFGSLIQLPENLAEKLPALAERVEAVIAHGGMFEKVAAKSLRPLVEQALLLARKYDAVVTNPPYMGTGAMNPTLSALTKKYFASARYDLMTCFMDKCLEQASPSGFVGMVNQHSWMFLSRFETFRRNVLQHYDISCLAHLGPRAFPEISGEVVQSTAFAMRKGRVGECGHFVRLVSFKTTEEKEQHLHDAGQRFSRTTDAFLTIPGAIVAYWASDTTLAHLQSDRRLADVAEARRGLQTGDAPLFIRNWHEVGLNNTQLELLSPDQSRQSRRQWFLFNNGGEFRKWSGNVDFVVNWRSNGAAIKATGKAIIPSEHHYFSDSITWSRLSGGRTGFRYVPQGIIPGDTGPGIFSQSSKLPLLAYLNSVVTAHFLDILVPSLTFLTGDIENLPIPDGVLSASPTAAQRCVELAESDWHEDESSWGFQLCPLTTYGLPDVHACQQRWSNEREARIEEMQQLERDNNAFYIELFGLTHELSAEVSRENVTLEIANREEDIKRLISYSLGCMLGRYSLDEPGLIYAHSGNQGFDPSKYLKFPADEDGIIPNTVQSHMTIERRKVFVG